MDKLSTVMNWIRCVVFSSVDKCYLGVICVLSERNGQSGDRLLNI